MIQDGWSIYGLIRPLLKNCEYKSLIVEIAIVLFINYKLVGLQEINLKL